MPFEEKRDRPNLGYVRGENWSLAVDAGHSDVHTKEFYALLEKEGLPSVFTQFRCSVVNFKKECGKKSVRFLMA